VHSNEILQLQNRLRSSRFEIENGVLAKVDEKIASRSQEHSEIHSLKSEVYDYMQSKLKQVTSSYSPKFTQLFKKVEALDEKFRTFNDLNNDTDF